MVKLPSVPSLIPYFAAVLGFAVCSPALLGWCCISVALDGQVEQHEMALQQQMEQQRLRWKSEIVSSNSMLNTVGGLSLIHI